MNGAHTHARVRTRRKLNFQCTLAVYVCVCKYERCSISNHRVQRRFCIKRQPVNFNNLREMSRILSRKKREKIHFPKYLNLHSQSIRIERKQKWNSSNKLSANCRCRCALDAVKITAAHSWHYYSHVHVQCTYMVKSYESLSWVYSCVHTHTLSLSVLLSLARSSMHSLSFHFDRKYVHSEVNHIFFSSNNFISFIIEFSLGK